MPLDLNRLSRLRPYLYHLTAQQNLSAIKLAGELQCASLLLHGAEMQAYLGARRKEHLELSNGTLVRDQRPLSAGSIVFEKGWNLERFISHVNEHVFFWPGNSSGPICAGLKHYARYKLEGPVILRLSVDLPTLSKLYFCRYNSGAPRCSAGKYSPRGGLTYQPAVQFSAKPYEVTEVVAKGRLSLPGCTEFAYSPSGPWRLLASAD